MGSKGDTTNNGNSRIVGGVTIQDNNYPFSVLIKLKYNKKNVAMCGGSIISKDWILTAAHCLVIVDGDRKGELNRTDFLVNGLMPNNKRMLYKRPMLKNEINYVVADPSMITIGYGSPSKASMSIASASAVVVHPELNLFDYENDIALIKLANPVEFSSTVKPIKIASAEISNNLNLLAVGWGVTANNSLVIPNTMRGVVLKTGDSSQCKLPWNNFTDNNSGQICCPTYKGKDTCFGDSGGPLLATEDDPLNSNKQNNYDNLRLVGVTSFGDTVDGETYQCADPNGVGYYTRAGYYLDFISKNTDLPASEISTNGRLIDTNIKDVDVAVSFTNRLEVKGSYFFVSLMCFFFWTGVL
ncbi:Plasma kallikrein [Zancudomyces culisetae]|uniref:Plasma kallikrein n=1 Tax=Zancudomyces culisetae TaxID=1213189 RepID=A0A1R1PQD6_ZANCU|nr:Plasma kallikrein [Zancudomyces culisetae]OMH83180.1 Plasma kallikrein [Zancudomyces culisetae]|eukprot:OMH82906.1 Plasma kallikrein [Zancudomyces culisetae]